MDEENEDVSDIRLACFLQILKNQIEIMDTIHAICRIESYPGRCWEDNIKATRKLTKELGG